MRSDGGRDSRKEGVKRKVPKEEKGDQGETGWKRKRREQGQCVTKKQYDLMPRLIAKKTDVKELSTFNKMKAKQSGTVQRKEKGHNKRKPIDWRDVVFRRGEDIKLTKDDHIWICAVCNNADDSCNYATCDDCHGKHRDSKCQKVAA